jgi:hypothetical protein
MNHNFSHWFLTSIYAVSIYTVHSLHELTAYVEVYLYSLYMNKNTNKVCDIADVYILLLSFWASCKS